MTWLEEQQKLIEMGFIVREEEIGDTEVVLISPSKGAMFDINWTPELLQYRSSMWMKEKKEPISLSFKKFFNWGERSEIFAPPADLTDAVLLEKLDGSTLIVSKFNGHLIHRTRGTVNAQDLESGFEIEELIKKYPKAFHNKWVDMEEYTFLYEWTSPFNRIVLDYGDEPDIHLIGVIENFSYNMLSQDRVDIIAQAIGVKRPTYYTFKDVEDMLSTIAAFKGKEGACAYFDQDILKVKGDEYLALHAFKNHCHINSIIDMFLAYDRPSYSEFTERVESAFDYECLRMAQGIISQVCDASKQIEQMLAHMQSFCDQIKDLQRKEQAAKIIEAYGNTERSGAVFTILDGKKVNDKSYKRFLYQLTKG